MFVLMVSDAESKQFIMPWKWFYDILKVLKSFMENNLDQGFYVSIPEKDPESINLFKVNKKTLEKAVKYVWS